jgi:copper chaperone CopZ
MESRTFHVPNISCKHCVMTIKRELGALEGVRRVEADLESKMVTVEWVPPATWGQIEGLLTEINYPPGA